jgi:hypothetical protein
LCNFVDYVSGNAFFERQFQPQLSKSGGRVIGNRQYFFQEYNLFKFKIPFFLSPPRGENKRGGPLEEG